MENRRVTFKELLESLPKPQPFSLGVLGLVLGQAKVQTLFSVSNIINSHKFYLVLPGYLVSAGSIINSLLSLVSNLSTFSELEQRYPRDQKKFFFRMLLFVIALIFPLSLITASFNLRTYFNTPLFIALTYIHSRLPECRGRTIKLYYVFVMPIQYRPWISALVSLITNFDFFGCIIGLFVGHCFYFVSEVLPKINSPYAKFFSWTRPLGAFEPVDNRHVDVDLDRR
ncbi:hypothetical protein BLNAU_14378 [Blattamonas nauphoetae]|uniref:Derlin n=1 Tax=Blattamonas nauphoetae TaxID=2049346 RepID=A0ABQ9XE19_9EUKA|nr:hypothetical protein BLNAU_14378 [Blattamonas nauphoetae]